MLCCALHSCDTQVLSTVFAHYSSPNCHTGPLKLTWGNPYCVSVGPSNCTVLGDDGANGNKAAAAVMLISIVIVILIVIVIV